jgi:glutaredoxin
MYIKPSEKGFTIYTKSQCPSCVQIKELLVDAQYINCDEYLEDVDNFLTFIWSLTDKVPTTFPMVFKDNKYIGGFKEVHTQFTTDAEF